jgi:prophage DNA circulation protein
MKTLLTLLPASFRGIPFLVNSTSFDAGRKIVTHEFPNSNNRTDEDLGRLNRTYNISATITGQFPFEYDIKKLALIAALDKPGVGILIHPFDGLLNVVAKTYTLTESENELNIATFNIVFSESTRNISPFTLSDTLSEIFTAVELAIAAISTLISLRYGVNTDAPSNISDGVKKVTGVSTLFTNAAQRFDADQSTSSTFRDALRVYKEATALNAVNGDALGANTTDLFQKIDDTTIAPSEALALYRTFFSYGDNDQNVLPTTAARLERNANRGLINALVQVTALSLSYRNASLVNFEREDQIQELAADLDAQYLKIIENDYLDDSSANALTDLKTKMANFFRQAEIAAYKINTIETNTLPISVLTYQYYGNLDLVDELIDLNGIQDVSFVKGEVEILTQ